MNRVSDNCNSSMEVGHVGKTGIVCGVQTVAMSDIDDHISTKNQTKTNKMEDNTMARKVRGDCTVGSLEKNLGIKPGSFRNPDGRDTRSDKLLRTLRKEFENSKKKH